MTQTIFSCFSGSTMHRISPSLLVCAFVSLAAWVVPGVTEAQKPQVSPSETKPKDAVIADLADGLSSKSLRTREQSTVDLLAVGEVALPTLKSLRPVDPEFARRLDSVIESLESSRFERLADEFLSGTSASVQDAFPGYSAYESLVGESRVSKLLFMEMYRHQPELVQLVGEARDQGDPAVKQRLVSVLTELAMETNLQRLEQGIRPEIGDVLAFLLAMSAVDETAPVEVSRMLELSSYSQPVTTYLRREGYADVVKRLYGEWIPKTQIDMSERALRLAVRFQQESGIEIARRCLSSSLSLSTRELALQMIALYGNDQDVKRLLPLLMDKSICRRFSGRSLPVAFQEEIFEADEAPPLGDSAPAKKKRPQSELQYFYRVCDLALASILMLTDSETEKVFPKFTRDPYYAFDVRSISLVAEEETVERRDASLRLWAEKLSAPEGKSGDVEAVPASELD